MTTYDDNLLAARFAALAPEPLAGNWDDVRRQGRRSEGPPTARAPWHVPARRRRLLVVLAAWRSSRWSAASAFAVRAFVLDKGFVGLPPVGATPSTPESGVLEMYYWVSDVKTWSRNWVYADGRLIRLGASRASEGRSAASSSNASRARESSSCDPRSSRQEGSDTPSRRPAARPLTASSRRRSRYARVTGSSPSGGRAI